MAVQGASVGVRCDSGTIANCIDEYGCPSNRCPDFTIKRHDTRPSFRLEVSDCDGALDLTDENLVVEVSVWAKGRLKRAIDANDTYFALADNIGFNQIMVGDIIVMDRVRRPEYMLVTAFDETNYFVQVQRGYSGTTASAWKRGTSLRIFRTMNATGSIESTLEDVREIDGSITEDKLTTTYLVYDWTANDTCLPGCFWMEFKLLRMTPVEAASVQMLSVPSVTPSFTPSTLSAEDFGCKMGDGVDWVRRFPANNEGFLLKIVDSPTAEL